MEDNKLKQIREENLTSFITYKNYEDCIKIHRESYAKLLEMANKNNESLQTKIIHVINNLESANECIFFRKKKIEDCINELRSIAYSICKYL